VKSTPAPRGLSIGDYETARLDFSRGQMVYLKIRQAIQLGRLKPGTRLRELELAKSLGTSRTPVREALGRLESEGIAVRDPVRGMIITQPDRSMIDELYAIREVLEGTAAALAARHASQIEIARLRQIAEWDLKVVNDPELLVSNNRLFHEAIYQAAHNRYLLKTLSALHDSMVLMGRTTLGQPIRAKRAVEEHQIILSSIESRDPGAAEEAAKIHIRAAHQSRIQLMLAAEDPRRSSLSGELPISDEDMPAIG
jgi:DNA-binding GntR family transcriptional regulator